MENPINEYYRLKNMEQKLHLVSGNGILNNGITEDGLMCRFNYYFDKEFSKEEKLELLKMVEEDIYIYIGKLGEKIEEVLNKKMKDIKKMIQKELGIPQYLGIDLINKGGEIINENKNL
jgi:hypothetical protein